MSAVGVAWLAIRIAAPADRGLVVGVAVAAYTLPGAAGAVLLARPLRGPGEPAPGRRRRGAARGDAEHDPAAVRAGRPAGRVVCGAAGGVFAAARLGHLRPVHVGRRAPAAAVPHDRERAAVGVFDGRLCDRPAAGRPGGGGCRACAAGCRRRRLLRDPGRRHRHGEGPAKVCRTRGSRPAGPGAGVRGDRPQPCAGRPARPDRRLLLPVRAGRGGPAAIRDRADCTAAPGCSACSGPCSGSAPPPAASSRDCPSPPGVAGPDRGGHRLGRRARPARPARACTFPPWPASPLAACSMRPTRPCPPPCSSGRARRKCSPRSWRPAAR